MKKNIIIIFLISFFHPLHAEILEISVFWNQAKCSAGCNELLRKNFGKLQEIESIEMKPAEGSASIKWKPNAPFSYRLIKNQMQLSGISLDYIHARVRGKASLSGKTLKLLSIGDGTIFHLVSPLSTRGSPNPQFIEPTKQLVDAVMNEAKEDKVLVIEGLLYRPHRSPPLNLIVEKIQVERKM